MERPLPDRIGAGETLQGVLLCPFGRFSSRDGRRVQVCDEAAFNKLAAAANADGAEILCDFEHKSEVDRIDSDTTAAAWISNLAVNKDGLVGDLRFTDVGAEAVSNRRLRFLSCVWTLDEGGRPARLRSVALTNTPNIPGEPVLNKAAPAMPPFLAELARRYDKRMNKAANSASYDESKHPRADDGKWTSGGGGSGSAPKQSGDVAAKFKAAAKKAAKDPAAAKFNDALKAARSRRDGAGIARAHMAALKAGYVWDKSIKGYRKPVVGISNPVG